MKKGIIHRGKFRDPSAPIEIFCNQEYRGYHVRGQVNEFSVISGNKDKTRIYAHRTYRLLFLALVNDAYQRERRDAESGPGYGILLGNTQEEYLEVRRSALTNKGPEDGTRVSSEKVEGPKNTGLVIDLKEANIEESSYLQKSIAARKNIILLHLEVVLSNVKKPWTVPSDIDVVHYPERIYSLIAPLAEEGPLEESCWKWVSGIHETLCFRFDYSYLNKKKYLSIMVQIGTLVYHWLKTGKTNKGVVRSLNMVKNRLITRVRPLRKFCQMFLDDLVDDLIDHRQIGKCQFCGDFFKCVRAKKYCSLKSEAKDCGKKARYRRWYEKHKSENRAKSRKEMRDTRTRYKEYGL